MPPSASMPAAGSLYSTLPEVQDVGSFQALFPQRPPVVSPDQQRMKRAVQRLLAQLHDCPQQIEKARTRIGGVLVTPRQVYDRMTGAEKQDCDKEGDARAIGRVVARLQALPAALTNAMESATTYLERRTKLVTTQCESDLDTMRDARMTYLVAHGRAVLDDEDFYWDLSRIATSELIASLATTISGSGFVLKVSGEKGRGNQPPVLRIEAADMPTSPTQEFAWTHKSFVVEDQYGPAPVGVSQVMGEVLVPQVGLDPLPLETKPIAANWERKPHSNVSVGDYSGSWLASAGYKYCRHEIQVYSNNNVCDNTVSVTERGVKVQATLKSGSKYVDAWRGWLRFRGELASIAKTATRCQVQSAECRSTYDSAQLVDIDPICRMGPGSHEDTEFEDLCFREGSLGREMCHYGTVGGDGRCRVNKIVPCPY